MIALEVWIALLIVLVMLGSALAVLLLRSHIAAVVAASVVSLTVTMIFVLLRALM
jgi:uncharacterized MnhB-related membrane protein